MADGIADDILRSGYNRWLRLEEAKAEVADDLRELFAELKTGGFDTKALRVSFRRVRDMDSAEVAEQEALVDLYVASLTRDARDAREEAPPLTGEILDGEPLSETAAQGGVPGIQNAGSSLGRVESSADGHNAGSSSGRTADFESANEGSNPSPATTSPETANKSEAQPVEQSGQSRVDDGGHVDDRSLPVDVAAPNSPVSVPAQAGESVSAAPAAIFGTEIVAREKCPPRPVRRHAFNTCWPDRWGMPLAIFADDIREHGVRKPIVKIDDEILDGWCRYTTARGLGLEYPVVQYHGDDPLADSIRWNLESGGRLLTLHEQKQIANKLAKVPGNEHRKEEILQLFGFKVEGKAA